jgi:hypothetical protein
MKDFIKKRLNESLKYYGVDNAEPEKDEYEIGVDENYYFNDGRFNKSGSNTLYKDDEPIIDFGVGKIGDIKIGDKIIPNAMFLQGGYNAAEQRKGYGSEGIRVIFKKLPKIENLILQCYDTACPFWFKNAGEEVAAKEMQGGNKLRTLVINRNSINQ